MAAIIIHVPDEGKARFVKKAKEMGVTQSKLGRMLINEGYHSLKKKNRKAPQ